MMRMLNLGRGRPSSGADAGLVRRVGGGGLGGVGRLLPCRLFWLVRGWGRMRLFSSALALAGLEVLGLGGFGVGGRGA